MGMLDDVKSKKKQKAAENWMKMAESAKTLEKQIEYYTKSLEIDPYNAEAWFNKGKGLERLGQFEEAKKCLDLAVEIDPDYQALIDKKYESNASSASSANEGSSFVSSPSEPVIEDEQDSGEWISETPETVTTEEEEVLKKDVYSFTPPVGEESIFSNAISGLDEDNGSPAIIREEEDDVFGSSQEASSVISEPEPELISDDDHMTAEKVDDVSSFASSFSPEPEEEAVKEREDSFSSEQRSATPETPSSFKTDENVISSKEPVASKSDSISSASSDISRKPIKSKMKAGSIPSSKPINSSRPVAISGSEMIDIRIPLNEAIKFWAIGIVAMLIVLIISSLL